MATAIVSLIVTAVSALTAPAALPATASSSPAPTAATADGPQIPAGLLCIRGRESGGDYRATSPGGRYSGAYQYDARTFGDFGGYARAADAPPAVQDAKALDGYSQGTTARHRLWPTSSRRCGL